MKKIYQIKFGNVVISHMKGIVAAHFLNLKTFTTTFKLAS